MSSDTIRIQALAVEAVIGVHDWERKIRQSLLLDLELKTDVAAAASTDKLCDALDYEAVADAVTQLAGASRFELVESLAEAIAQLVIERFPVMAVKLSLAKPGALAGNAVVSVNIERSR